MNNIDAIQSLMAKHDWSVYKQYAEMYHENKHEELVAQLNNDQLDDETIIPCILLHTLWIETAEKDSDFSRWLVENAQQFKFTQSALDLALAVSVYRFRGDSVQAFLQLGAEPNQTVLPERNLLDICIHRMGFSYGSVCAHKYGFDNDDDELAFTVEQLKRHGAVSFMEEQYAEKIGDRIIFDFIDPRDSWVEPMLEDLSIQSGEAKVAWFSLLKHCSTKSSKPSSSWKKQLANYMDDINNKTFIETTKKCFKAAQNPRKTSVFGTRKHAPYYFHSESMHESNDIWAVTDKSACMIKGLIWLLELYDPHAVSDIGHITRTMYRKYYMLGLRSVRIGNAGFEALLRLGNKGIETAKDIYENSDEKTARSKMLKLKGEHF